jgi:hypothetical protein
MGLFSVIFGGELPNFIRNFKQTGLVELPLFTQSHSRYRDLFAQQVVEEIVYRIPQIFAVLLSDFCTKKSSTS